MGRKLTKEQGDWLQGLGTHFDEYVFQGLLPRHVIAISDRQGIGDSYLKLYSKQYEDNPDSVHEIYLNRETFNDEIIDVYKALLKQQLRLFQWNRGTRPKAGWGYHSKEFSDLAKLRGLICKGVGKDEGKDYGWTVELYIEHGGLAMKAIEALPNKLKVAPFKSLSSEFIEVSTTKPKRRTIKCITCGFNGQFTGINSHFKYCPMCAHEILGKLNVEPTMVVQE